MIGRLAAPALGLLSATLTMTATGSEPVQPAGYLFTTFRGEETPLSEQVYFAISRDGKQWSAFNDGKPVLVSELGEKGARDPFLLRSADGGKFFLIATDLSIHHNRDWKRSVRSGSKSIVVWESPDLVNWSEPRLVKVAPDDAGCTWAPEVIHDPEHDDYLVFWASTTARDHFEKHRIWAARTKDFVTFGEPFVFIEKPNTIIDTTIVRDGDAYYRFTKDEKFKAITLETSPKLSGPWTDVAGFNLAGLVGYEGPEAYELEPAQNGQPARWCLILDHFAKSEGYKFWTTSDLKTGQFEPAGDVQFPFKLRHGSVLPLTAEELTRLETQWGAKPNRPGASRNPVLPGLFADPDLIYSHKNRRFYLYPTTDGVADWNASQFRAFSSEDLTNWKDEGVILDLEPDVSWAQRCAWAPCLIEKKTPEGYRYYFYFTAEQQIGVAVADDPAGPFKDSGRPVISAFPPGVNRGQQIDPAVFADPLSGKTFLYWGNQYLAGAELSGDMLAIRKDTLKILTPDATFREGVNVFFREGRYYFLWSEDDTRNENYRVRYATAKSPLGPLEIPANNLVLSKDPAAGIYATGHNSVLQIPGTDNWVIAYHRFVYPHGISMGRDAGYHREVCMDALHFSPDGSILPVAPTHTGVAPLRLAGREQQNADAPSWR